MSTDSDHGDLTSAAQDVLGQYLRLTPMEIKKLPNSKKVELLRELRLRPIRCPPLVSLCCAELLLSGSEGSGLGDEAWSIAEQGAFAALDCGDVDTAKAFFLTLKNKFGAKSIRVRKIAGVIREAMGDIPKAEEIYDDILQEALTDTFCIKRKSAIKKAAGDYQGAIICLEKAMHYEDKTGEETEQFSYMEIHRGTEEVVYRELFLLNFYLGRTAKCLFYAEELVLLEPMSYLGYIRLAESLYSAGSLERAANCYAQSLRLNDGARAVYGLWLTASELVAAAIKAGGGGGGSSAVQQQRQREVDVVALADAKTLLAFATNKLKTLYSGSSQKPMLMLTLQRAEETKADASQRK